MPYAKLYLPFRQNFKCIKLQNSNYKLLQSTLKMNPVSPEQRPVEFFYTPVKLYPVRVIKKSCPVRLVSVPVEFFLLLLGFGSV